MGWLNDFDALTNAWTAGLGWTTEAVIRLVLAMVCGGLVGLERELRGREAGFRTNALVCLGSCMVMVVSIAFAHHDWSPPEASRGVQITVDPARIAYGVMGGIGFLGAGAILKNGATVKGLTTAAGMWCVAAIGLASGAGLYVVTTIGTVLVLLTLWVLDYAEAALPKQRFYEVVVRKRWEPGCVRATVKRLRSFGLRVVDADFTRTPDLTNADVRLRVAVTRKLHWYELEDKVEAADGYQLISTREV